MKTIKNNTVGKISNAKNFTPIKNDPVNTGNLLEDFLVNKINGHEEMAMDQFREYYVNLAKSIHESLVDDDQN